MIIKWYKFITLLGALAFCTPAFANNLLEPQRKDLLIVVGPENCPYNCALASKRDYSELEHYNAQSQYERADPNSPKFFDGYGYVVDILKEIFEPAGHKVSYKIFPRTEALRKVGNGRYEFFVGLTKAESEALGDKNLLLSKHSIGNSQKQFFVTSDFDWQFYDFESLYNMNLGLVENRKYPELGEYFDYNKTLKQKIQFEPEPVDAATQTNLRKLVRGQVNAIFEDANIVNFHLQSMSLVGQVASAGAAEGDLQKSELFLGISKNYPEAKYLQKTFDNGIEKLRKTGKLNKILLKYNLQDWYIPPKEEQNEAQ